jgi:ABC-type Fe3+/spermidine/putrescine transport system ATPase subunit
MINVSGITKRYGDRVAVDNMSFDVAAGTVTGFVGPNGAGKSTAMRMMVGLTRPDVGVVRYGGVEYTDLSHPRNTGRNGPRHRRPRNGSKAASRRILARYAPTIGACRRTAR